MPTLYKKYRWDNELQRVQRVLSNVGDSDFSRTAASELVITFGVIFEIKRNLHGCLVIEFVLHEEEANILYVFVLL